jgi:hypothetical protein
MTSTWSLGRGDDFSLDLRLERAVEEEEEELEAAMGVLLVEGEPDQVDP